MSELLINANSLKIPLVDESVHMVACSPPFYGLRAYSGEQAQIWGGNVDCQHEWVKSIRKGTSGGIKSKKVQIKGQENFQIVPDTENAICEKCEAWYGELGQEPTPEQFVENMVLVGREIWRVLRSDGTFWLNLGSTYFGSGGAGGDYNKGGIREGQPKFCGTAKMTQGNESHWKNKDLIMIPAMCALALQKDRWWLRSEIIWKKRNAMPSSATDRPSVNHESIFLLTKNKNYYYDRIAVLEPYTKPLNRWGGEELIDHENDTWGKETGQSSYRDRDMRPNLEGKNRRTVWDIPTKPFSGAHFACWPPDLVEIMIKAGSKKGDIVLDSFCGSGTTLQVARELGRNAIGFDLSFPYLKDVAQDRLGITALRQFQKGVSAISVSVNDIFQTRS